MSSKIISVYFLPFCETLENGASCLCLIYFTYKPLLWCFCHTSEQFGRSWFLFLIHKNSPKRCDQIFEGRSLCPLSRYSEIWMIQKTDILTLCLGHNQLGRELQKKKILNNFPSLFILNRVKCALYKTELPDLRLRISVYVKPHLSYTLCPKLILKDHFVQTAA